MFIIKISYNFLYVWNFMKLYKKKFPIYENCMIIIFGEPRIFMMIMYKQKKIIAVISRRAKVCLKVFPYFLECDKKL